MSKPFGKGTISLLQDALDTATKLGIERIVIDNFSLRGESQENATLMLLPFPDGTELDFGSIGIGRVPVLQARLKLLGVGGTITPEYKQRDSGEQFVFRLELKKNKTKIDFKCTDPAQVRAPKAFKDPDAFRFQFTSEDINLMINAKRAMQADTVTLGSKDGSVVNYSISATEGDALVHELSSELESMTGTGTFSSSYKTKILFPVLKEISDEAKEGPVDVVVTKRGILKIEVNGIPSYIFPEV